MKEVCQLQISSARQHTEEAVYKSRQLTIAHVSCKLHHIGVDDLMQCVSALSKASFTPHDTRSPVGLFTLEFVNSSSRDVTRVTRSRYMTGPAGFLVQGPVDNFTYNQTGESPVFYPVFILTTLK